MSGIKHINFFNGTLFLVLCLIFMPFSEKNLALAQDTSNYLEHQEDSLVFRGEVPQYYESTAFDTPHELRATIPFVQEQRLRDHTTTVITFWILFSVFVVAVTKYLFPLRFKETLMAAWDSRFFNHLERETGLLNHWVSLFLYINYLLSFSLLLYQSIVYFKVSHLLNHTGTLLLLVLSLFFILVFFTLKYLFMYVTGWVFKSEGPTFIYLRNILLVNKFTGIILLPFLVINHFNGSAYILAFAWILVILMEMFRLLKVARIGLSIKGFSVYHLILYLCAVEFGPLLFIIKYSQTLIY